jgi:hypothetical protein
MRYGFRIKKRDAAAAGLLCLLGMAAVLQVSANSLARVSGWGTGVLPVVLGAALMGAGVLWLFESRLSPDEDDDDDIGVSKWRSCCGVMSGIFAFLLLGKYVGVVPAAFALVYISVLGDSAYSWRRALLPAAIGAAVAALVLKAWPSLPFSLLS